MSPQPKTFIVRDCACCSDQPTVPPDCPACKGAGGFSRFHIADGLLSRVLPAQPVPAPVGDGGAIEALADCVPWTAWPITDADSEPSDPGVGHCTEWYIGIWHAKDPEPLFKILVGVGRNGENVARRIAERLRSEVNTIGIRAALDSIPAVGGAMETLPEGVEAKTKYLASDGKEYSSVASAVDRNEDIARAERANALLAAGASVWDAAQAAARFPQHEAPEVLKRITAKTPLIISHWQCRDEPGYKVCRFENNAYDIFVGGDAGSWSGAYGNTMDVRDLARYAEDTLRKHPELAAEPLPAAPTQTAREGGDHV